MLFNEIKLNLVFSFSVTIEETAGFGNIIAPVGGTTETIYSVREEDGGKPLINITHSVL